MTAFQIQTFIPRDGNLSITLPVHLRETDVELSISAKRMDHPPQLSKEECFFVFVNEVKMRLVTQFSGQSPA